MNVNTPRPVETLATGPTEFKIGGHVGLPDAKSFPGELIVDNRLFDLKARIFGDNEWVSIHDMGHAKRIFIYSETEPIKKSADRIRDLAKSTGAKVMFRSKKYVENRTRFEIPHAFISHDSKDRATAQTIATYLQNRLCPVWYDEFSLSVGDNLRESIEKGLKESKKCILVLSRDFLSNPGWTKKEFDSIFTREILEQTRLILPVWLNVSTEDVFAYSPSLANVFALNWVELGEEEVCKKLHKAIV